MPSTILSDNGVSSGTSGIKTTGSNDGALALQTTTAGGTATTALTIDTSQNVSFVNNITVNGNNISADNSLGFRNRIINGDMRIDQRNAGASVTPTTSNNVFSVDRWLCNASQASKYTVQQNAGSVTPPAGFVNYMGVTSSSAYSITSSDYFFLEQDIEGLNCGDLGFGTANAKTVTVSFWVRSSLTGTFGGSLRNSSGGRSYPFSYTINSANTWEFETITIAGDTSGTWLTTNGIGIRLSFSIGSGSNWAGTAGAWNSDNDWTVSDAVSVVGTNGATFYITGVQLEVGSVATPFERRDYGREFILCQRYYEKSANNTNLIWTGDATTGNNYYATGLFAVSKRASPTFTGTITAGTGFSGGAPADSGADISGWNIAQACNSTGARRYYTFGFTASAEL